MFARIRSIAVSASRAVLLLLSLAGLGGCPSTGTPGTGTPDDTTPSGTVTVNVIAAVNGASTNWAQYVPLGERTFPVWLANKSFSDLLQQPFVETQFNVPGVDSDRFNWASHVPSISAGVTVPAASGLFELLLHYTSTSGSFASLKFVAYEGTVNITAVSGNTISFQATARMELAGRLASSAPGSLGYVDVSVSGTATLGDP